VPVLVFGVGAVDAYAAGLEFEGHLSILGAELLLALLGAPFATVTALRIAID
jgi:heme exporter protein B